MTFKAIIIIFRDFLSKTNAKQIPDMFN